MGCVGGRGSGCVGGLVEFSFFLGGSFFLGPVRVPRRVEPGAVVSDFCHRATRGGKWGARGRVSSDIRALAGGEDTPTHRIYCSILGNMNNMGIHNIYKNRVT